MTNEQEPNVNPLLKDTIKSQDFYEEYANNVFLEPSVWDMKLIFGQLDQREIPIKVEQRVSVTLPWVQAKIFAYLLCLHLAGYEMQNGKINIPMAVMPPEPIQPTEEMKKADPNAQQFFERMIWLREQFFGSNLRA